LSADMLAQTTVYADRFWLVQSLQNLLDNAIHFAESIVTITIHTSINKEVVTIDIFNDGKAIPDYALAKAFDRYFSLSHQRLMTINANQSHSDNREESTNHTFNSAPKKGTGLGLTLVKQVVEHHGGSVSLNNAITEVNEQQVSGVKVSITLPLAKP
ncbi:ATP-binding protein, partial [Psychrobacter sp. T6-1]